MSMPRLDMTLGTAFTINWACFPNSDPIYRWSVQSRGCKIEQFSEKVEVSIPVASPLTIIKEHVSMKTEER